MHLFIQREVFCVSSSCQSFSCSAVRNEQRSIPYRAERRTASNVDSFRCYPWLEGRWWFSSFSQEIFRTTILLPRRKTGLRLVHNWNNCTYPIQVVYIRLIALLTMSIHSKNESPHFAVQWLDLTMLVTMCKEACSCCWSKQCYNSYQYSNFGIFDETGPSIL